MRLQIVIAAVAVAAIGGLVGLPALLEGSEQANVEPIELGSERKRDDAQRRPDRRERERDTERRHSVGQARSADDSAGTSAAAVPDDSAVAPAPPPAPTPAPVLSDDDLDDDLEGSDDGDDGADDGDD